MPYHLQTNAKTCRGGMVKWSAGKTFFSLGRETSTGWKTGLSPSFSHSGVAVKRREREVQGNGCCLQTHPPWQPAAFLQPVAWKAQTSWHATISEKLVSYGTGLLTLAEIFCYPQYPICSVHCYSLQKWIERLFHSYFSDLRNMLLGLASELSTSTSRLKKIFPEITSKSRCRE